METTVKLRHIKQSARKVRFIVNEVRGIKVTTALEKLYISNKKASLTIKKAIESGLANLVNLENDFNKDDSPSREYVMKYIYELYVGIIYSMLYNI